MDAAKAWGIPRGTLAAYEAGRELPSAEEAIAILQEFQLANLPVSIDLIWQDSEALKKIAQN